MISVYRRKETIKAVQIKNRESVDAVCTMLGDSHKVEVSDNSEFGLVINTEPARFLDYIILDNRGNTSIFSEFGFNGQFELVGEIG